MRYRLIDEAINSKSSPYPSLKKIIEHVNESLADLMEDTSVSRRTVQKDLHDMRFSEELGFFAPIEYDQGRKGYYYDDEHFSISKLPLKEEERGVIEWVANMLSRYEDMPMFSNFRHITQKIFDALNIHSGIENDQLLESAIQFDAPHEATGNHWLSPISEAIKHYRKIRVEYQPFGSDKVHIRVVHPYILREFKSRWYLIGFSETSGELRTYALDRMPGVEVMEQNFPVDTSFDRKKYFQYSFGIYNLKDKEPQEVVLEIDKIQGQYLLTRPLHHTQKKLSEENGRMKLTMKIFISEDFIMEILSYGDRVKVLEPSDLVDDVRERIKRAAEKYGPA